MKKQVALLVVTAAVTCFGLSAQARASTEPATDSRIVVTVAGVEELAPKQADKNAEPSDGYIKLAKRG